VLLKSDRKGRVFTPAWKREEIVDEYERSGMSGPAFAEYVGVKYATFIGWVQRRKQGKAEAESADAAQGAVAAHSAEPRPAPLALLEAVVEPELEPDRAAVSAAHTGVELETADGLKLRVSCRDDVALAVELIQALGATHLTQAK
jgi:hypothetical protein